MNENREKLSALRTAEFFEERRARADVGAALEIMNRKRGEPPRADDAFKPPQAA